MSEHTSFYEKIGITPLINASETYTNLGGSLMDERTVEAMRQAGEHFVDYPLLLQKVSERAAELTNNESAFVTTGAAGGVILSAAAAMCGPDEKKLDQLPHVESFEKNEILMFDGKFREIIPYWRLTGLTGAKIVSVEPTVEAMVNAVNEKLKERYCTFIHKSVVYKRKNKRIAKDEKPTISGLVFVQGESDDIQSFLCENFFGLYLVKDCSTGKIAVIHNNVMQSFMQVSQVEPARIRFMPHTFDYYSSGNTLVRITSGPLTGLEGYRIRISRDKCLVTSIGGMTVAIGGIYKESFENIDEYVRQRRELLCKESQEECFTLTSCQSEIAQCFFTPQNQMDVMAIGSALNLWIVKAESYIKEKNFDKAVEITLFILNKIGNCFHSIYSDPRIKNFKEINAVCCNADKILISVLNSVDVSVDLKEIIKSERRSLVICYPFLPMEL